MDEETAEEIAKTFIEAIAAPDYVRKRRRRAGVEENLATAARSRPRREELVVKSISGGYLAQTADTTVWTAPTQVKSERAPTEEEWARSSSVGRFAKHVKSNAIVYARAGQTVSVGAGQMSRVDSVKVGAMKAMLPLPGTVVASDAFFPFPDGVEEAPSTASRR